MSRVTLSPAPHFGWTLETGKRYPYRGFTVQRENPQIFQETTMGQMIALKGAMLKAAGPLPGQGDCRDGVIFRLNMLGEPYPNAHVMELQQFQGDTLIKSWTTPQALNPKKPHLRNAFILSGQKAIQTAAKAFQKQFPTPPPAPQEPERNPSQPTTPPRRRWGLWRVF